MEKKESHQEDGTIKRWIGLLNFSILIRAIIKCCFWCKRTITFIRYNLLTNSCFASLPWKCWQKYTGKKRYCQYVGKEIELCRQILRKWYIYKLPASIFDYNPTIHELHLPKKITDADLFQIDDVIVSFKRAFDKINDVLKSPTDNWNGNEKRKELIRRQTFVEFPLANYRKKLFSDFIEESYFLYDKSNLIKESITEINKLISIYGSISYFGKKINKIAEIISSNKPLEFDVEKDTIKNSLDFQLTKTNGTNVLCC